MLCLHILQSSLGLINTLMIQDTLALPEWAGVLTDADRRGLTALLGGQLFVRSHATRRRWHPRGFPSPPAFLGPPRDLGRVSPGQAAQSRDLAPQQFVRLPFAEALSEPATWASKSETGRNRGRSGNGVRSLG